IPTTNIDGGPLASGVSADWLAASPDDRAARYLAWMGLGGTQANIPPGLLLIVGNTPVVGRARESSPGSSANMLAIAEGLCRSVLNYNIAGDGAFTSASPWYTLNNAGNGLPNNTLLIANNGDAELWLNLCTLNNPAPVHVVDGDGKVVTLQGLYNRVPQSAFQCDPGQSCSIGNDRGGVESVPCHNGPGTICADNRRPWCLAKYWAALNSPPPAEPNSAFDPPKPEGHEDWPYCPDSITQSYTSAPLTAVFTRDDEGPWTIRGAANAGMAVFVYLDQVAHGLAPLPSYDQCELLQ
ncbi:MAG: hypothetical protein FWD17_15000, partial [Polyangiaceae bacterium]|nr:hypothetical protein [Polyangiaceae bacterium]